MWLLYDADLPQSLGDEAPSEDLRRWSGGDVSDEDLVRFVSDQGGRGLILLGRNSLEQPDLRRLAEELGVALIAVATDGPVEAKRRAASSDSGRPWRQVATDGPVEPKRRVLKNLNALRRSLDSEDALLVLANEVRPAP